MIIHTTWFVFATLTCYNPIHVYNIAEPRNSKQDAIVLAKLIDNKTKFKRDKQTCFYSNVQVVAK